MSSRKFITSFEKGKSDTINGPTVDAGCVTNIINVHSGMGSVHYQYVSHQQDGFMELFNIDTQNVNLSIVHFPN